MKYDILKLENQISFSLYALSREIIKMYKPYLDKLNLTYTQYITMLVMWDDERILYKDLEQKLHLDSGTIAPVLRKLQSMKLINKFRPEEDERIVIIELTDKGREMRDDALNITGQILSSSVVPAEEAGKLKEELDKVIEELSS